MINKIKDILENTDNISDWIITENKSVSTEIFLVKDKIDMNRACDTEEYSIVVFVDFEEDGKKYRGESKILLGPSYSEEEIEEKIKSAAFSARFVKNPWYPLPENEGGNYIEIKGFENNKDIKEKFDQVHKIIYKDYKYNARVNSCEIFAVEAKNRVVTSKGIDVEYPKSEFSFEIVTDSNIGKEAVEIFNGYYLKNINLEEIEKIVDKQLMETEGRSKAVRNKKMENMRVILSSEAVEELLQFYLEQARDLSIYQKVSKAKIGESFQKEEAKEKITIKMNPALESSINARPLDGEGKKLKEYLLYENGRVKDLVTSAKYSHYLGIENRGTCSTFEVNGGEKSLEEYKREDYVEILAFSSFIMDPVTGDFGGEFRLAKLVEDGKESYITGGSISENIFKAQNNMYFSKEKTVRKNSISPAAIIFDGITVAGE